MPRTRVEQEPLASWRATVDSAAREPAAMKVRHQRNQSRWAPRCFVDTPLKRAMNESRSEWTVLMRLMVPSERSLES